MANNDDERRPPPQEKKTTHHQPGGTEITPTKPDPRGDSAPGFGGEGSRSELGDGRPLDEETRRRNAENNRRLAQAEENAKRGR